MIFFYFYRSGSFPRSIDKSNSTGKREKEERKRQEESGEGSTQKSQAIKTRSKNDVSRRKIKGL